jgi:hypothetical protein
MSARVTGVLFTHCELRVAACDDWFGGYGVLNLILVCLTRARIRVDMR